MKLKLYSVFDKLAGQSLMILTSQNNEVFKRMVRSALMSKAPNPINTDTKDKDVYVVGEIDTESQKVIAEDLPKFAFSIEAVRQELVELIAAETGKEVQDPSEVKEDE